MRNIHSLAFVPILPVKSCSFRCGWGSWGRTVLSPSWCSECHRGCWGGELTFRRVGLLLKSKSTFELQLKTEEDSLVWCSQEGSQCWPADHYRSPFAFKDLLMQNFREDIPGALGPLVCWGHPMSGHAVTTQKQKLPVKKKPKQWHFSVRWKTLQLLHQQK